MKHVKLGLIERAGIDKTSLNVVAHQLQALMNSENPPAPLAHIKSKFFRIEKRLPWDVDLSGRTDGMKGRCFVVGNEIHRVVCRARSEDVWVTQFIQMPDTLDEAIQAGRFRGWCMGSGRPISDLQIAEAEEFPADKFEQAGRLMTAGA